MAKEKRKFNKHIAILCIVPVLVLVVTMSIMGVTFAWFNDAEETTIACLNMSVSKTFQMTFDIGAEKNEPLPVMDERYVYAGQTAFDSDGYLVTDVHAREIKKLDPKGDLYDMYMLDKAFVASFALAIDTNTYNDAKEVIRRNKVEFNCIIESVEIQNPKEENVKLIFPSDNGTPENTSDDISPEDIKLGFTWYISDGYTWYTPYGTIISSNSTDKEHPNGPLAGLNEDDWKSSIPVSDFEASGEGYTFNIVFAPEELFWKQYGDANDYMQSAQNIYSDLFNNGTPSEKWVKINSYSLDGYAGSIYSFSVLLTVNSVTEVK